MRKTAVERTGNDRGKCLQRDHASGHRAGLFTQPACCPPSPFERPDITVPSGGLIGGSCGATRATKVPHPLVTVLPGGPSYDAPHVVAGHTAEPQGPRGLGRVGKQIHFLAPTLGTRLRFRVRRQVGHKWGMRTTSRRRGLVPIATTPVSLSMVGQPKVGEL